MQIHFLKTIWSDIIILNEDGHTAMIDTGTKEQYPQIDAYLKKLGVSKLDFILLTHFHKDHYGSIPDIIDNYETDKVYFKEYAPCDNTNSSGRPTDDAYRLNELAVYNEMALHIRQKSELIPVETVSEIEFNGRTIKLFYNKNTMREVFEDKSNEETYHQYLYNQNLNSLAAFMKVNGRNVFFGGDIQDLPAAHPKADYICLKVAKAIGEKIDVYKAPHHGTMHTGLPETLRLFDPKLAIFTNGEEFLYQRSDSIKNLMEACPDVKIMLTEKQDIIVDIDENGVISVKNQI